MVQLPALRRAGYRFHLDFDWREQWRDSKVLQPHVARGPCPGSVVQLNVLVQFSIFASCLTIKGRAR